MSSFIKELETIQALAWALVSQNELSSGSAQLVYTPIPNLQLILHKTKIIYPISIHISSLNPSTILQQHLCSGNRTSNRRPMQRSLPHVINSMNITTMLYYHHHQNKQLRSKHTDLTIN